MEIKPLDSKVWTNVEGEEYKEILMKEEPKPEMTREVIDNELLGEDKFIGVSQVAELLEMTVDRVRYLSRLDRIPSFTLRDRGTRIYERDKILELMKPF
jgi:hypothetical protein